LVLIFITQVAPGLALHIAWNLNSFIGFQVSSVKSGVEIAVGKAYGAKAYKSIQNPVIYF